jgi:arsenate reductase/regulatory protein spx
VDEVLNRRSPAYKEMDLASKKLTKTQAVGLIQKEPNLLRRPLVISGKKVVFGFDAGRYDDLF